jgi:hypothetical protein
VPMSIRVPVWKMFISTKSSSFWASSTSRNKRTNHSKERWSWLSQ